MKRPATLFRYRSLAGDGFRHTQDLFLRHRLYIPLSSQFNDPTGGAYRHRKGLVQRGSSLFAPDCPLLLPKEHVRVVSFTEDHRNTLMCSHYADYHRELEKGDMGTIGTIPSESLQSFPRPFAPDARAISLGLAPTRAAFDGES